MSRFGFGEAWICGAERFRPPEQMPVFATWPCRGCDERRLVDDAWLVYVTELPGRNLPRPVLICASCAVRVGVVGGGPELVVGSPEGTALSGS